MNLSSTPSSAQELHLAFRQLKEEQPKLRIRDAASHLGASEAQLLALDCGKTVTRLAITDWNSFMKELKPLGRVMVLTRNEQCVHERTGEYENISGHGGKIGLITGKDIDLRLFYSEWAFAYAVTVEARGQPLHSFQFFDASGHAIHKVYLKNDEALPIYKALVEKYRAEDQSQEQPVSAPKPKEALKETLTEDEREAFVQSWSELKDTHDFFVMLHKHGVTRLCSMESAEGRFTFPVGNDTATKLLHAASERNVPIMVFVGNDAAIQIHTGPVNKIVPMDNWINVLDPDFNLHLKTDGIARSWIVEKPTKDGTVTSLEIYDDNGELIAQFFGARKPGIPERDDWRALASELKG